MSDYLFWLQVMPDIFQGPYDNSTEEDMEESPQNSRAYTFLNESPIVIEDDDDDSLSDINNSGIIHGPYDNSTEEDMEESPQNSRAYSFLNESPIVIEDDDDDSLSDINNSGIIHVGYILNMPIPNHQITVSDNSKDISDSGIELIEPLMRSKKNIMYGATKNSNLFIRQKKNNSLNLNKSKSTAILNMPIYIRSNDILARCSMLNSNDSLSHRLKSTIKREKMSSFPKFVQLSSNSKSLKQSGSLPLSHTTSETHRLQITRVVKKPSNMYKVLLIDKINYLAPQNDSSDKDDTSKKFISCNYEHCGTLVEEPELLIDGLYCSLACKNNKQTVIKEEHFIDKTSVPTKKTTVDRNHIFTKLENRINKTKQLKTSSPEEIDDCNEQLIHFFNESSKEENQQPLKSLLTISSPEAIDDDDNDPLIKDKDVLKYMKKLQHKSAPVKLFDRPFPTEKNLFVVGEKLEGIDPKNEALFCVLTISEVRGYRIKLHFDGFKDKYDFWVNADCPDLFHPGWCKLNSRILQPPHNYRNVFNWTDYLKKCQASPAPKCNFFFTKNINSCENPHKFHIGGKLEALDKLSHTSIPDVYVATVADILGNRIRIHFDGWKDCYDYWVNITSTYIHPVGWCEKNGRTLYPYRNYDDNKGKKPFNWTKYLADTNSEPVPEDAFVGRPIREFSKKMIIEVVDLVVPRLLRIAKVVDVRGDELKIVYDGFDDDYAYWVEDDSPDIHPVGWSSKTNHPIEVPPASDTLWTCNIRGCKGYGNSSNGLKINHVKVKDCPYEMNAWKNAVKLLENKPYRLKTRDIVINTTLKR
ncbi:hypothetical protein QTP88_023775 [Uroleucon formosanum]